MEKQNLKEPLLGSVTSVAPKKILYDQAILAAFAWASSNFFFGILTSHDFATSCLQFSGYLLLSLSIRLYQIMVDGKNVSTAFFATYINAQA